MCLVGFHHTGEQIQQSRFFGLVEAGQGAILRGYRRNRRLGAQTPAGSGEFQLVAAPVDR